MKHYFPLIIIFFYISSESIAQVNQNVYFGDLIPKHLSVSEFESELLNQARIKSVELTSGIRIDSFESFNQSDGSNGYFNAYRQLIRSSVSGKIIDESVPVFIRRNDSLFIQYEAVIQEIETSSDTFFTLTLNGNKNVFNPGESLKLLVLSSQDAYLTLISIRDDNTVGVLFPNVYMTDNFLHANMQRIIPNELESNIIEFIMLEEPGKSVYSELILAIATKEPVSFAELSGSLEYENDWVALNKWLVQFDRKTWTEAYFEYQVFNN